MYFALHPAIILKNTYSFSKTLIKHHFCKSSLTESNSLLYTAAVFKHTPMIASIMQYSLLENETFEIGVLVHPEHTMWHKAGTQLVFIELNETDIWATL